MNKLKLYLATVAALVFGGENLMAQSLQFEDPQQLPTTVNSGAEESLPLFSPDGNTMYFVRTFHPDNQGGKDGGQSIWYSTRGADGTWSAAQNNLSALNTKGNNAVAGVSADGNTIYLVNTYEKKGTTGVGISKSTLSEGNWSDPVKLNVPGINPITDSYSFYMTPEEDVLFISMEDNTSKGKNDIYISTKDAQGSWNVPTNIGDRVNTTAHEISPFLSHDKKRLYFSSYGRGGMGDADIFYVERQGEGWTSWSMPVNLPAGVNSSAFDAYFTVLANDEVFFCSNRDDSLSNIYRTVVTDPTKKTEEETEEEITEQTVLDSSSDSKLDKNLTEVVTEEKKQPLTPKQQIDADESLDNIYFDYDKWDLKPQGIAVLNIVVDELKKDPSLKVRLEGHCDDRGSQEYNLPLSDNRANECRKYLINKGISADRISTKGKGKVKPTVPNDSEANRALNRRVEVFFEE
jgi:outer membrane protein OmpA-like peptidoglycan-associated protein